jgi:hypothetical protein
LDAERVRDGARVSEGRLHRAAVPASAREASRK